MADRKQTPDILGEILRDTSPAPVTPAVAPGETEQAPSDSPGAPRVARSAPPAVSTRPEVRRERTAAARKPPAPQAEAQDGAMEDKTEAPVFIRRWEYLIISFQEHNGWRPRFVNGEELEDWTQLPPIHDYANLLGDLGWEMAGASGGGALYGNGDVRQLCFKREKQNA